MRKKSRNTGKKEEKGGKKEEKRRKKGKRGEQGDIFFFMPKFLTAQKCSCAETTNGTLLTNWPPIAGTFAQLNKRSFRPPLVFANLEPRVRKSQACGLANSQNSTKLEFRQRQKIPNFLTAQWLELPKFLGATCVILHI